MQKSVSEATSAYLEAAAEDLQRQLRSAATIVGMRTGDAADQLTLVATLRIGESTFELFGAGDNLVDAYRDLLGHAPERILAATYREVLLRPTGRRRSAR